ncbi:MAG: hypothetical protein IKA36_02440 [Clostridia bacterium]|nr:hypothetical protein [Clostridia bacterium]
MGFSIPKLEIPKLPELDVNAAIGKLTQTFDPSADVGAVSGNISSQLSSLESMRSQLSSIRDNAQKAAAAADFKALSEYTTGLQAMTDISCIMSSAKPSFTPMTPESLSLPLLKGSGGLDASALSGGLGAGGLGDVGSGILSSDLAKEAIGAYLGVDPAIVDAAMSGDVETLTSPDTLTDLAIAGAGAYVSGMTGGVIPPQVASNVIDSVAGEAINSTISGTMSGDLTAVSNLQPSNLTGTDALNIAKSAIGSDPSGGMLEGALTQTQSGVISKLSNGTLSSMTSTDLTNIARSAVDKVGASSFGSNIGGINTTDVTSLALANGINVINRSSSEGDVFAAENILNIMSENGLPDKMFSTTVANLSSVMPVNPDTKRTYSELYERYVGNNTTSTFNTVSENPAIYSTNVAENIYGKDDARKRAALMKIATTKRATTNVGVGSVERYAKA